MMTLEMSDTEVMSAIFMTANQHGYSFTVEPIRSDAEPDGDTPQELLRAVLGGNRGAGGISGWRAMFVNQQANDGYVASGPTPVIAMRSVWASYITTREAASQMPQFDGGEWGDTPR